MKKSLIKLVFSAFAAVIMFTSCLGDGENVTERSYVFAYIGYDASKGGIYAAVDGWYITSPYIQTLNVGSCYLISYRTSMEEVASGVFKAEDITQPESLTSTYGRVTAPTIEDTFPITTFQPAVYAFSNYYGDNWLFTYTGKLKEKDTARAHFFYDTERQYEITTNGSQKDLEKNQMIIDVRFDYITGADGTASPRSLYSVGALGEIKTRYYAEHFNDLVWATQGSSKYASVSIKFRYNQGQSDGTTKEVYVGEWGTSSPYCFWYFEE